MLGHVVGRASEAPGAQPAGARARGGLVACLIARDRLQSLERPAVKDEAERRIGADRLAAEPAHPALQRLVAEADQRSIPIAADHLVNELVLEEDDGVFRLRRNFEAATGGSAGWEQGEIRRRRGLKRKPAPGDVERHPPDARPVPEQRGAGLPECPVNRRVRAPPQEFEAGAGPLGAEGVRQLAPDAPLLVTGRALDHSLRPADRVRAGRATPAYQAKGGSGSRAP